MQTLFKRIILMQVILLSLIANAQIVPLKVGDKVPDIALGKVLNYKSNSLKISDFRGKLVILYFWGIHCKGCLVHLPYIDSIQKTFKDKVQVIMFSPDGKEETLEFFRKRKLIKMPSIPMVTEDTIMHKLFPSTTVSLNVWVNKDGVIDYLAEHFETNGSVIRKYLNGEKQDLAEFKGKVKNRSSWFEKDAEPLLKYYSYLSKYNNVNLGSGINTDGGINITECGSSVVNLFYKAYNEGYKNKFQLPGRMILQIDDSIKYISPKLGSESYRFWEDNYCYCYQLFLPKERKGQEYQIMRQDLERYFNLEGKVEKRRVKGLALVRTSNFDKLATKGGKPLSKMDIVQKFEPEFDSIRFVRNKPFQFFAFQISNLVEYELGLGFEDRTGYKGNVDASFSGAAVDAVSKLKQNNIEKFRRELNRYDLDLIEIETDIDVLVIREK